MLTLGEIIAMTENSKSDYTAEKALLEYGTRNPFRSPEHAIIEAALAHGPSDPIWLAEYARDIMNVLYNDVSLMAATLNLLNAGFLVMDPYEGMIHNGLPYHTCSLNADRWNTFQAATQFFGFNK